MASFRAVLLFFFSVIQCQSAHQIDIERDFNYPIIENFSVYWNVPTFQCHEFGINFQKHAENFGITINDGDKFHGGNISILHDPGKFPAMVKDANGSLVPRNGGIPQLGDLDKHLKEFEKTEKTNAERL